MRSRATDALRRARRPRRRALAIAGAAIVSLAIVVRVATGASGPAGPAPDAQPGAARVAPSTTTTTATTTTTSTTTTTTTTTVAPTTTQPAPVTAAPDPAPVAAPATAAPPAPPPPPAGARCLVRLHGKGGSGAATAQAGDVTQLAPSGNAAAWGGRQWLYFAPASFEDAFASIAQAVDAHACGQVIVDGFSNGGAMAVRLYCRGESFGGRLVRVVADDPVPDHGADGCSPPPGVPLTIYWTGALAAAAQPGWNCAEQDWTCEGGSTVGIAAYAANASAEVKASPYGTHQWYTNAPELGAWR